MKMTTCGRGGLFVVAASVCWAAIAWAQAPVKGEAEATVVTVESLEKQMPVGLLGVPLGTVVRVTGVAFDGNETRAKLDAGKTLLRIMEVDSKKLAKPVVFEFFRAAASVKKPAADTKFDYYVHEYGEFDGVVEPPKELGIKEEIVAHDGFGYRRRLTVHASNPLPK